ncbi:hypothetical protein TSAR_015314 [Trichomalopsis sarcophagae]|uniref:Uncharacterized protein n=1 Tax=Trichomalopsis sarcophagae TaxID=543379 RepID=A0A232EDG0_9HYME|nr:hypothetical protein TSAR_015314 [Trichomalopsis sarcophagae]
MNNNECILVLFSNQQKAVTGYLVDSGITSLSLVKYFLYRPLFRAFGIFLRYTRKVLASEYTEI